MNLNHHPSHRRPRPGNPTPPAALWVPDPNVPTPRPRPDQTPLSAVLPNWAIDRIRAEFTRPHHLDDLPLPLPLLRLAIPDNRLGMDARTRCTTDTPHAACRRRAVVLAELNPDALPARWKAPHPQAAESDDWPGFFHRTHRLLTHGGLLLIAARQQRLAGRLIDPLGALIAHARAAGFIYQQHIIVIHGHLAGERIEPDPVPEMPPGVLHSDLLVLERVSDHCS